MLDITRINSKIIFNSNNNQKETQRRRQYLRKFGVWDYGSQTGNESTTNVPAL